MLFSYKSTRLLIHVDHCVTTLDQFKHCALMTLDYLNVLLLNSARPIVLPSVSHMYQWCTLLLGISLWVFPSWQSIQLLALIWIMSFIERCLRVFSIIFLVNETHIINLTPVGSCCGAIWGKGKVSVSNLLLTKRINRLHMLAYACISPTCYPVLTIEDAVSHIYDTCFHPKADLFSQQRSHCYSTQQKFQTQSYIVSHL